VGDAVAGGVCGKDKGRLSCEKLEVDGTDDVKARVLIVDDSEDKRNEDEETKGKDGSKC